MTHRAPKSRRKLAPGLSAVIGAILVPLTALAAVAVDDVVSTQSDLANPVDVAAVRAPVADVAPLAVTAADDIALACGPEGLELVAAESAGTISDIQQAALDALRPICAEDGVPLPGRSQSEPVARLVSSDDGQPKVDNVDTQVVVDDDDWDDDDWDDDDWDDDDDHDDDHDDDDDDDWDDD